MEHWLWTTQTRVSHSEALAVGHTDKGVTQWSIGCGLHRQGCHTVKHWLWTTQTRVSHSGALAVDHTDKGVAPYFSSGSTGIRPGAGGAGGFHHKEHLLAPPFTSLDQTECATNNLCFQRITKRTLLQKLMPCSCEYRYKPRVGKSTGYLTTH